MLKRGGVLAEHGYASQALGATLAVRSTLGSVAPSSGCGKGVEGGAESGNGTGAECGG
jgi:hypothetical protein